MSAMILRIIVILVIAAIVALGARRIWRDWTRAFRADDEQKRAEIRARDLKERKRSDVIDLKRSGDGVFRPPSNDDDRHRG